MAKPRVLIMAGGTGGHIFPALATAEVLRQEGAEVHWLGTPASMEAKIVPQYDIDISYINISGLRGKGLKSLISAPYRLLKALFEAIGLLRRYKPTCVLGMGGYASGPGGIAARLLKVPLVIHEQNAVAGMTNKWLARIATKVLEAFPGVFSKSLGACFTGNPVRNTIHCLKHDYGSQRPLRLLVVGGSLGAVAINQVIPKGLALCDVDIEVLHQAGQRNLDTAKGIYKNLGVCGQVEPFINDMASAYKWADLVLCRAGALTIAELANAGKPSLLVPFPFAVDDHQTQNAKFLVQRGAAELIPQDQLTPEKVADLLRKYANNRQLLEVMAAAARDEARPNAASEVAHACLEVSLG